MRKALLRLFNTVQVNNLVKNDHANIMGRMIRNGYILQPEIVPDESMLKDIEDIYGISGEKANQSFHKSWKKVSEASIEQLVTEQIIHYITTYGFEAFGIYSDDTVYIPHEKLEVQELGSDITLVVIKAMTKEEVLFKIIELGAAGIALKKETLQDLMKIVEHNKYDPEFISKITNREFKGLLVDLYGICPSEPVEYLRWLVTKLTNESLLIKNKYLIDKIKESNGKFLDELLRQAPDDLASIFYRYKPLFLAMKTISRNKSFFNKLRKDAVIMHKPLKGDFLNDVTGKLKHKGINLAKLQTALESASIFRKIRLLYALNYRLNPCESIVYKIRNGRSWAEEFTYSGDVRDAFATVLESVVHSIKNNVEGKIIYIPEGINYALPATEKQFAGNLPANSFAVVKEDLIVGVHWYDIGHKRIDLDLSMINENGKIGWDSDYRTSNRSILFSGDMTSAPKPLGATELFYVKQNSAEDKLIFLNYFNFNQSIPVPFKIIVASEKAKNFGSNYMVDPNNIICSTNCIIDVKQMFVGLVVNNGEENRIYFSASGVGSGITSRYDENTKRIKEYLLHVAKNPISLNMILSEAGAIVTAEKPEEGFMDYSPSALDRNSFINLLL